MKLSWTNTEWDNFSGVASQDNLLMLNAGDDFLNAQGDETLLSEKEIKSRITRVSVGRLFSTRAKKWTAVTEPTSNQIEGAKKYYRAQFPYDVKTSVEVLQSHLSKANSELSSWQGVENNGEGEMTYNPYTLGLNDYKVVQNATKAKANIRALDSTIIPELTTALEKATALKEKADADAKAKAQAEADAKAEKEKTAKMKSLNDALINAKTPEEKASIQAQIDALVGNVAKGGSKTITYALVGIVVVVGAYMLLKNRN
jgi:hypothetical protein